MEQFIFIIIIGGELPKVLIYMMDNNIMITPERHSLHHSQSDRNWSIFFGLIDNQLAYIANTLNLIKVREYIKPTIINTSTDYRLRIPPLWEFWLNYGKDIVYNRKFSPENSWAYFNDKQTECNVD